MSYEIGQRIKAIRLSKGITLEEFGKLFNANKSVVNNWEKGRNKPSPERLKVLAKIGDTTIKALIEPIYNECDNCAYNLLKADYNFCPMCGISTNKQIGGIEND